MLFITALPENLSERDKLLEIEDEQRKLIEAVGKLEATGSPPKIITEFLDNAALEEINAALSARRHDIVHLSGHGAYLAHVQQGCFSWKMNGATSSRHPGLNSARPCGSTNASNCLSWVLARRPFAGQAA